jgi:hypothetical protein
MTRIAELVALMADLDQDLQTAVAAEMPAAAEEFRTRLHETALELKRLREELNPIPFNPHLTMTGMDQRLALEALRTIFDAAARVGDPDFGDDEDAQVTDLGLAVLQIRDNMLKGRG